MKFVTARIRSNSAFTMVEIAFSLAIVAFALVAIMGVLPTGMNVQKDNREDTLINNDAAFWTEAMRSGSRGIYDLTNFVEEITITPSVGRAQRWTNTWDNNSQITSSEQIIALLSTPKLEPGARGLLITNTVTARVRAVNGPAIDMRSPKNVEFAFRYQLESEVTSVYPAPLDETSKNRRIYWTEYGQPAEPYHLTVATNLHNVRLTLRWPVFEQGNSWGVGRNRRTIVALANGRATPTPRDFAQKRDTIEGRTNTTVHPNTYQYVSIQPQP